MPTDDRHRAGNIGGGDFDRVRPARFSSALDVLHGASAEHFSVLGAIEQQLGRVWHPRLSVADERLP